MNSPTFNKKFDNYFVYTKCTEYDEGKKLVSFEFCVMSLGEKNREWNTLNNINADISNTKQTNKQSS